MWQQRKFKSRNCVTLEQIELQKSTSSKVMKPVPDGSNKLKICRPSSAGKQPLSFISNTRWPNPSSRSFKPGGEESRFIAGKKRVDSIKSRLFLMFAFKSCSMFYKSIACPKSTIKQTQNTGNDFVIHTLDAKEPNSQGSL